MRVGGGTKVQNSLPYYCSPQMSDNQYDSLCTKLHRQINIGPILLDFSLTVKVATLIFISGCGSAISSAKEGISGFIYNLVISFLSSANVHAFHENPYPIHTELTFINITLKAHDHKMNIFVVH